MLLQYVQDGSRLTRAITVIKTRASHHEPVAHRYEISEKGLVLGTRWLSSGSARVLWRLFLITPDDQASGVGEIVALVRSPFGDLAAPALPSVLEAPRR